MTNIGDIFGPGVQVTVAGSLREVDRASLESPKRFVAGINQDKLCKIELRIAGHTLSRTSADFHRTFMPMEESRHSLSRNALAQTSKDLYANGKFIAKISRSVYRDKH